MAWVSVLVGSSAALVSSSSVSPRQPRRAGRPPRSPPRQAPPRAPPRPRPRRPCSRRHGLLGHLGRSRLGLLGGLLGGGRLGGGLLGRRPALLSWWRAGLRRVGLGHQLDDRHRGVVALAGADLGDPGVAARTLGERRRDLGEQRVHDRLVADGLEHLTTVVQVARLALVISFSATGRSTRALASVVVIRPCSNSCGGQVGDDQPLVGRAAAEAGTLLGLGHVLLSILPGRVRYRSRWLAVIGGVGSSSARRGRRAGSSDVSTARPRRTRRRRRRRTPPGRRAGRSRARCP